ncbi:MAG: hypothetical protein L6V93_22235 [Clostridiales bacterium]|nr:MAG: hypothetical protein L6V93_22235 [Clostridiales bacterium]
MKKTLKKKNDETSCLSEKAVALGALVVLVGVAGYLNFCFTTNRTVQKARLTSMSKR